MRYAKPSHVLNIWSRILKDITTLIERLLKPYQWDDTCTMIDTWRECGLFNVNVLAWLANNKRDSGRLVVHLDCGYACWDGSVVLQLKQHWVLHKTLDAGQDFKWDEVMKKLTYEASFM